MSVSLSSVTPNTGPPAGGTSVRIVGSGFVSSGVSRVAFGGVNAQWFRVIDDNTLTAMSPQGVPGASTLYVYDAASNVSLLWWSYATPGSVPYPDRGRWRLTVHNRDFSGLPYTSTIIGDLPNARGRQLTQVWNAPAELTFTVDTESAEAATIQELRTDIMAWRWDETSGADVAVGRFIVDHSEDELSEDSAVTVFTCHDYLGMLSRRFLTANWILTSTDQDQIVAGLLARATSSCQSSSGTSFMPGSYLPLTVANMNPDGTMRANSGVMRDRTYLGNQNIGQALDDLAKVQGGFDYDCAPTSRRAGPGAIGDDLRLWYPSQGVTRGDLTFAYGAQIRALTRTVASDNYSNYVRMLGNNQSNTATDPQYFGEAWNADANNVGVNAIGLWMDAQNAADVTVMATLVQQAQGALNIEGLLVPAYSATLSPGVYRWGSPNMGDTVGLVVQKGRLNVNTTARVMGILYDIGEDGEEDVQLTLGRSPLSLFNILSAAGKDVAALARR